MVTVQRPTKSHYEVNSRVRGVLEVAWEGTYNSIFYPIIVIIWQGPIKLHYKLSLRRYSAESNEVRRGQAVEVSVEERGSGGWRGGEGKC